MTDEHFSRCIQLLRQGDMTGLKEIFEAYGKMVYSTVLQVCRDLHTAEDITSEFFLKLSKAAAVYKEGLGHKKWLLTSARNLAIDYIRKQRREIAFSTAASDGDDASDPMEDVADKRDTEEEVTSKAEAEAMLGVLNESEREIVNMKIYCQLTFAEIAQVLKIPQGTVSWRYRSAIHKLRKHCKEVRI